MPHYRIAIIGSGNVGYHLALHLQQAGHNITQIFSRNIFSAERPAHLTEAEAIDNLDKLKKDADIYLVCVKDSAIKEVAAKLNLGDKIVAHTSASVEVQALDGASVSKGVFYPLQSFSKNLSVNFFNIPILVEANDEATTDTLLQLAQTLSNAVYQVDYKKRLAVHTAAVFANNFTNYLFAIAEKIMQQEELPFKLLLPLINETVRKIQVNSPMDMQTGPARRNDAETIIKHLDYLADDEQLRTLYELLSKNITRLK